MNPGRSDRDLIFALATSKRASKAVFVAASLRLADHLASGPKSVAQLARITGTHAPSLHRLFRALASLGVFAEVAPRKFGLTAAAELLRERSETLRGAIMMNNDHFHEQAWDELLYSVRTGRPGFDRAHGRPLFAHLARDRRASAVFNRAMTDGALIPLSAVLDAYDFSGIKKLADIGGGHGVLMASILERYPKMQGLVYDQPSVVRGARRWLKLRGLASRCRALGGDFFKSVPEADGIIMSRIIHDWDDERSRRILRNCRRALSAGGRLIVVEATIPPGNAPALSKLLDLEMLVMTGGRERTTDEFARLFKRSGFRLRRVIPAYAGVAVIEGIPA
ncbi:MAG TPA: methyltransferase [Opitutaceae bacterium]